MANTTNFGWETPDDTDLVKDGALAMRTLGNAIDTSLVDLKGGTTGQVLSKNTNTDMDFVWTTPNVGDITEVQAGTGISVASGTGPIPVVTNTVATTFDAKGDLVVGTGADTFAKLTVGTNGHTLVADSSTATGLKWAAPAGGGKVLQVVNATYNVETQNNTNTYADTGLTATITPSSATSKILVLVSQNGIKKNDDTRVGIKLLRGATDLILLEQGAGETQTITQNYVGGTSTSYLDSPNTTSATTYKTQFRSVDNATYARVQQSSSVSTMTLLEIGA